MRHFTVSAVLLVAVACAVQNNPMPGPDDVDDGGSSSDAGKASGGAGKGGSSNTNAGSSTGGKPSAGSGGMIENMGGDESGGTTSQGGTGGKASGGSGGKGGSTGTAGSGGKGGSGGAAGSGGNGGNGGSGGGSGGAGCTPTSSNPLAGISARYEPEKTATADFNIGAKLIVANIGPNTVNLADLKLRYYFTNEVTATVMTMINWAYFRPNAGGAQDSKSGKVTQTLMPMSCKTASADTYFEFTFAADIGTLSPGNQVYFSWSATNTNSEKFTQTNDYSFDAAAKEATDDSKLVVLQNSGNRVWGTEP